MTLGGTKGVVPAADVTLNSEELKAQKKTLRAKIKIARKKLTQEVNHWDKQLLKYEKKSKEGRLTNSARSLIQSSSEVSQETMLQQLAVVTGALEELVFMCGNLRCTESSLLEEWLDELLREIDDQKDVVNNAIEELSDRSEELLIQK